MVTFLLTLSIDCLKKMMYNSCKCKEVTFMSSTEPQNKTGSKRLSSALRNIKIKSTHLKVTACAILAAAVGITGTFCLAGNPGSSKIVNRSLSAGLDNSAINPQYIEHVTRAYSETKPTDPPTDPPTKATEAPTKKRSPTRRRQRSRLPSRQKKKSQRKKQRKRRPTLLQTRQSQKQKQL